MKWPITSSGARSLATTSAPSPAWQITPIGSRTPNRARCQRKGRRRKASTAAAITAMPDEAGDQPVAVLDHRVCLQRRHGAAVALRPVGAAEPGAGEADGGAGHDDHRQRDQGDVGHLPVLLGRYLQALPHGQVMMPRRGRRAAGPAAGSAARGPASGRRCRYRHHRCRPRLRAVEEIR